MMKKADVRIRGNVQMAGFRTFIKNIADSRNLKGFAENVEDGSVRVVCEGEEEGITGLISSVKESSPSFAHVDEVSVEYGDYKGEFTSFERRGDDIPQKATLDDLLSVLKSFDTKAERLVSILSDMNVTLKSVKEDTKVLPNMNVTLKSVKEDTKVLPSIKESTEKMLGKQDTTIDILRDVKDSLGVLTEIYRETLDLKDKYEKLSIDVEAIKTKLSLEV
ncbi:Acylphosphatase [subsurface metagenome]